jgi:ADP-heptose:LPS heptosyltransferase
MKTAIVFRFSAMGDVALTLPALLSVLEKQEDLRIIMVTRKRFAPFFVGQERVEVYPCDFEGTHRGPAGLWQLFRELRTYRPDYVIDLHQNLRTTVLKFLFSFTGIKISSLDKQRAEKKAILSGERNTPLPHVTEQYKAVFKKAGLAFSEHSIARPMIHISEAAKKKVASWEVKGPYIGLAPFAQHKGKVWPLEKYQDLLPALLNKYPQHTVLLFGGGQKEKDLLQILAGERSINTVGAFSLEEELALIEKLDFMICGDTSNLHFASLMGTPVYSIWGATHTLTGFGPLYDPEEHLIQIPKEELTCRPCSVFGNKPCRRGDYACLEWIRPTAVLEKLPTSLPNP